MTTGIITTRQPARRRRVQRRVGLLLESLAVIQLYKEQRAGVYAGASTSTQVIHIRMIRADVAIVDADYELTGLRGSSVANKGRILFVAAKQPDQRWLITAIRGIPGQPAQTGR